jgi:hypothetical protein
MSREAGAAHPARPRRTSGILAYSGFPVFAALPAEGMAATVVQVLAFDLMRWLMIALLVSLGVLLLAAAGVARHIRAHRTSPQREVIPPDLTEEAETETEH